MAELFKAMARSPPTKRRKWTIVEIVEHFCVFVHAFRWESRFETKDFVTGGKLRMFIIVELFCVPSCYVLFIWARDFLSLVKFCGTASTATHADSNRICVVTFAVNCFQLVHQCWWINILQLLNLNSKLGPDEDQRAKLVLIFSSLSRKVGIFTWNMKLLQFQSNCWIFEAKSQFYRFIAPKASAEGACI